MTALHRERVISSPAHRSRTPVEIADDNQNHREQEQPEAEGVHSRERHIAHTQMQRQQVIAQSHQAKRDDEEEQHNHTVHGEDFVVLLPHQKGIVGNRKLGADAQSQNSGDGKAHQAGHHIGNANLFVVSGGHVIPQNSPEARAGVCRSLHWNLYCHLFTTPYRSSTLYREKLSLEKSFVLG